MQQGATRHVILPVLMGATVLLISFTLLTIIARSPYTQANLNAGFDYRYTRTEQTFVGDPLPVMGDGLAVPQASDPVERGRQLFITNECASCHGLDGSGGIIGPSIVGMKASKLRSRTLVGPKGMPAYSPDALTDDDLAAIAAYVNARSK